MTEIATQVRSLLETITSSAGFADTEDLFASGLIRSLHLMELVTAVEDTFQITIDERDLHERRLRSVEQICALVVERRRPS